MLISDSAKDTSYRVHIDPQPKSEGWVVKIERSRDGDHQWEVIYHETIPGMISDALEAVCQVMWDEELQIWD